MGLLDDALRLSDDEATSAESRKPSLLDSMPGAEDTPTPETLDDLPPIPEISPEQATNLYQLEGKTGLPALELVGKEGEYTQEEEKKKRREEFDFTLANVPELGAVLTHPVKGPAVADDVEYLSASAQAWKVFKGLHRSLPAGLLAIPESALEIFGTVAEANVTATRLYNRLFGDRAGNLISAETNEEAAKALYEGSDTVRALAEKVRIDRTGLGDVSQGVLSGAESTAQSISLLAAGIALRSKSFLVGSFGALAAGQAAHTAREKGLGLLERTQFGIQQGVIEAATEAIPGFKFMDDILLGSGLFKTLLNNMAREIPGEQLATILQDLNEQVTLHPEKSLGDYLKERPSAALQTLVATIVGTGGQTLAIQGPATLARKLGRPDKTQEQALGVEELQQRLAGVQEQELLQSQIELAKESKVLERDPALFDEVTADIAGEDVYLDSTEVREFFQGDPEGFEAFVAALPEVAAQMEEATAMGGDLIIPAQKVIRAFAQNENWGTLQQELRLSPTSISEKAFEDTVLNQVVPEMERDQQRTEEEVLINDTAKRLENEITATGQSRPSARKQAQAFKSFYTAQRTRLAGNEAAIAKLDESFAKLSVHRGDAGPVEGLAQESVFRSGATPEQGAAFDRMFEDAERVQPIYGVALTTMADALGGRAVLPPVKGRERAAEKTVTDYENDPTQLKDLVRGTLELSSVQDAPTAVNYIRNNFEVVGEIRESLVDEAQVPSSGYRDIKANVVVDGHVTEIQVNIPELLMAKEMSHQLYGVARGTTPISTELKGALDSLSATLYDMALASHIEQGDLRALADSIIETGRDGVQALNASYGVDINVEKAVEKILKPFSMAEFSGKGLGGSLSYAQALVIPSLDTMATGTPSTLSSSEPSGGVSTGVTSKSSIPPSSTLDLVLAQPRVSTRVPDAAGGPENEDPMSGGLSVGVPPEHLQEYLDDYNTRAMAKIRGYVGFTGDTVEEFVTHLKDNLRWVYNLIPEEVRNRSKNWYVGANTVVNNFAEEYSLEPEAVAGVMAVLSPQKDWFMNASMGERVIDIWTHHQDTPWSRKMGGVSRSIYAKREYRQDLNAIRGKTLGELTDRTQQAMWLRAYDEAHNDRRHRVLNPEGEFREYVTTGAGAEGVVAWSTLASIAKALSILEDPSIENRHLQLGKNHKVRSFYNNIIDPSHSEDVTIDTHAVGAALFRAMGSSTAEVLHNFGTPSQKNLGYRGTYAIYADAYRQLAAELDLLPREVQSITWEAIRTTFTAGWKTEKNVQAVDAIWARVEEGEITADVARQEILDLAGGIPDPTWHRGPDSAETAEPSNSSYEKKLSGVQPSGRGAQPVSGGARIDAPLAASRAGVEGRRRRATFYQSGGTGQTGHARIDERDGRLSSPPVREDGRVELTHWSRTPGLTELDPSFHGTGLRGAERKRKEQDPLNWVDRTYYGIAVGQPGGYIKEAGLGSEQYAALIDDGALYDMLGDPDGFGAQVNPADGNFASIKERLIRDAGYEGYWVEHPTMGLIAASYVPLQASQVMEQDLPPTRHTADTARGSISFSDEATVIRLFEQADLSTLLHEAAHFFVETQRTIAQMPDAPKEVLDDWQTMLTWVGSEDGQLTTEHHEKLARGFERYLREGKAPSSSLRRFFATFQRWLVEVYKDVRNLNVEINDDIRAVFDRMLATEEEISALGVKHTYQEDPNFLSLLTKAERQAYMSRLQRTLDTAKRKLMADTMEELAREQEAWWKEARAQVRAQVTLEVEAMPVYKAWHFLSTGKLLDRPTPPELEAFKLDRATVKRLYGDVALPRGVQGRQGEHPDIVAELFGFGTGADMVQALSTAVPREQHIDQLTDDLMLARHGDMLNDGSMERRAREMVENDDRTQNLLYEMQVLARQTGNAVASRQMFEEAADALLGSKLLNDVVTPHKYYIAEVRAARESGKALGKKDYVLAAEWKRKQTLNHLMYKKANEMKADVIKTQRRFNRYLKPLKRGAPHMDEDYHNRVKWILNQYGFGRAVTRAALSPTEQQTLRDALDGWLEQKRAEGADFVDPGTVFATNRISIRDLTVDEWLNLRDLVDNIAAQGRSSIYVTKEGKRVERKVIGAAARASMNANHAPKDKLHQTRTKSAERKHNLQTLFYGVIKARTMIRWLDGFKDLGVVHDLLMRPIDAAENRKVRRQRQAGADLNALFDTHYGGKLGSLVSMRQKLSVPALAPEGLTKDGMLAVAFNWLNADNRTKLLEGHKWEETDVLAAMETHLDARDWAFVEEVRDYIDGFWNEISALEKRSKGVTPKKVTGEPFTIRTSDGQILTIDGGYYPIKYDDRISAKAPDPLTMEFADLMKSGRFGSAQTAQGHTKTREEGVDMAIRLDLGPMFQHVNQVITDLEMREAVTDVYRMLNQNDVRAGIEETAGVPVYRQLDMWIRDVATGAAVAEAGIVGVLDGMRAGTSISVMGFKLSTILVQFTGISQTLVRIGPVATMRGLAKVFGNGNPANINKNIAMVFDKSKMMKDRSHTFHRDVFDSLRRLERNGRIRGEVAKWGFAPIVATQIMVDTVSWLGAYEKGLKDFQGNEDQAVEFADMVIAQAQATGLTKDLSAFERGSASAQHRMMPLLKLLTVFYSYFNTKLNLAYESAARTDFTKPRDVARFATDYLLLFWVEAVIGEFILGRMPDFDEEEDKDPLTWNLMATLQNMANTIPILREIAGGMRGFDAAPAGLRGLDAIADASTSMVTEFKAALDPNDEVEWLKLIRSANAAGGIVFKYPAAQMNQALKAMQKQREGEEVSLIDYFLHIPE